MRYRWARNALFALEAERAHELTLAGLKALPSAAGWMLSAKTVDDPFQWCGLRFRNRVGLAAGLDKNAECLAAWERLGFGFVEVGTVTPRPQPGNPRPRLFRLPQQQALINRLGFNNKGVEYLVGQVERANYRGVLGINIGKNADTPIDRAVDDYLICFDRVAPYASYVTINISSPNTKNLRELQRQERLADLLEQIADRRDQITATLGRRVPLMVKIAPDLGDDQIDDIAQTVRSQGIDGLIATNTTLSRPGLENVAKAEQAGGMSGAPMARLARDTLGKFRARLDKDTLLIGLGGINSAQAAADRIAAGADLLQIYTGFIYQGPELIAACARAVASQHDG